MKTVTLYAILSKNFGSNIHYDAEKGERTLRCSARGAVWNTDSKFNGKQCDVTFSRGTQASLSQFSQMHDVLAACGSILISGNLESEKFKHDGKEIAIPPIEIFVSIDDVTYDNVEKLLGSSIKNETTASLTVQFSSKDFKEFLMLEELDTSQKSSYPIVSFEIGQGWRGDSRIRTPHYEYDSKKSSRGCYALA